MSQGGWRCSFCGRIALQGETGVSNVMRTAYICKNCIFRFRDELRKPIPTIPPAPKPKDPT